MFKKTKIIATISDKNCDLDFLQTLYDNGMNAVRLNTAHQSMEGAVKVIENIRKISDKIAILVDTKGPEIRTNIMDEPLIVKRGEKIRMSGNPGVNSTKDCIHVSYAGFVNDVAIGSKILIDDGILELIALEKDGKALICEVLNNGKIEGRKSINLPSAMVKLPALTRKDMDFIRFAAEQNLDFIAHSFVRKAEDVIAVQSILDAMDSPIKIIAKIENKEGVDNIDEILEHVYGVMVARGDLAIEISAEKLPLVQKMIIKKCVEARKPVIVATQMLHTMIENPHPTRAEVSDIANAILDGADALMLSGETAYGKFPVEAVKMMTAISLEVEKQIKPFLEMPPKIISTQKAAFMVKAAVGATVNLPVGVIVADTSSGNTVRGLAAYRGPALIYAQCYSRQTMRFLALSFGVYAEFIQHDEMHDAFLQQALQNLKNHSMLQPDALIVVVAGNFGKSGGTSLLEIGSLTELSDFIVNN
ncbi:MAG: pyruvate kinase [Bacteroidales bacterium]|nr:pyruvate kinase [Bacteroidales bacterium]